MVNINDLKKDRGCRFYLGQRQSHPNKYPIKCLKRSAAQSRWVTFLTLRGFVLLSEIREFGPAFRHCQKNLGAFDRDAAPARARRAVGGACPALIRANHSSPQIALLSSRPWC
jgi:hypothetical protein